jgi:hypothetical protein
LASRLSKETGEGRTFSPSYSLPYQTVAQSGLEAVDGINPLQLWEYRDYMSEATGFSKTEYSVTLPPFPSGDPTEPWQMTFDSEKLAKLNVSHVISAYPLQQDHLTLAWVKDEAYIYRMDSTRPRAWIEYEGAGRTTWTPVDSIEWTPNWIAVNVNGPGKLVLSELAYPGWQVSLNSEKVEIEVVDAIFRGVDLPAGHHVVTFRFLPWTVFVGIGITFLALISLIVMQTKR